MLDGRKRTSDSFERTEKERTIGKGPEIERTRTQRERTEKKRENRRNNKEWLWTAIKQIANDAGEGKETDRTITREKERIIAEY